MGISRRYGALNPEDPYRVFDHPAGPVLIVPLFVLYDYSFRPGDVALRDVAEWAAAGNALCNDEFLLHPDPYASRAAWCEARCRHTEARLARCDPHLPTVLINHFPLLEQHAVLPLVPRFTPWCGTRLTADWHIRFRARAVIHGHLHIRRTRWTDGVPFQEVSLGYPRQWRQSLGIGAYLHEVILGGDGG
ncbi:MAG: hypothetical protein AAF982_08275 [Pseudomonadota bacterium]